MKLLYTNENRIMVMNVKNVLINNGYEVVLNNEFASSASGGLSPFDTWPEVWLLKDSELEEAKKVIESIDTEISLITWKCGDCNEINDQTFDFCWKCGRDNFQ
ncbi:DUF2007 domain-containing protein [Candidatus Thioglobus sp.]|nr:DUF2007 domain-containing protein [Candidatus Thioglobus sp.]